MAHPNDNETAKKIWVHMSDCTLRANAFEAKLDGFDEAAIAVLQLMRAQADMAMTAYRQAGGLIGA